MIENVHRLIDHIVRVMFEPEVRFQNQQIRDLTRQNNEAHSQKVVGFLFNGKHYVPSDNRERQPKRLPIHDSLTDKVVTFVKNSNQVVGDKQFVKQQLFQLLHFCDTLQDIRDALPDSLRDVFSEVSVLPRQREEAWCLRSSPMLLKQYWKVTDLISFYSATRLLY